MTKLNGYFPRITVKRARIFVILAAALLVAACSPRTERLPAPESVSHDEETARLVSHATSGLIAPGEPVRVRFQEGVLGPEAQSRPLPSSIFSFTPSIAGKVAWEDNRTLVYIPSQRLRARQAYRGSLDLGKLPGRETKERRKLDFLFSVKGREIESLSTDLRAFDSAKPHLVEYVGSVSFTEAPEKGSIEKAVRLELAGRKVELTFTEGRTSRDFQFSSGPLERTAEGKDLLLSFDERELDLSGPVEKRGFLEAKDRVSLLSVEPAEKDRRGTYRLTFSDELAPDQDLAGLVRFEPSLKTSVRKNGRTVLVSGDFRPGNTYVLKIASGVRSRQGTRTDRDTERSIEVEDLKPELSFVQAGVFLPTTGDRKVFIRTVNLRRARVEIKKVFENNMVQFLQTEKLSSAKTRSQEFDSSALSRVGVTVASQVLEIGETKNVPLVSELDLRKLIAPKDRGIYIVSLNFQREDMIWNSDENSGRGRRNDDYYSNPASDGYVWARGRIYKPVMVTDVGLTWKAGGGSHTVFVTDLLSAAPTRGALVRLMTYQNQAVAEGYTDNEGRIVFEGVRDEVFFVTAEREGMRSVLKANEMAWNLSSFDTGGTDAPENGTRAFLYTDRGVYRPGDVVHLSALFRNADGGFPENHPVSLKFFNPRGQERYGRTSKTGKDGFYSFSVETRDDDPTGTWNASLTAGGSVFQTPIRIETVVPNRLKVLLEAKPRELGPGDGDLSVLLSSNYLFGAPAAGLDYEARVKVFSREPKFASRPDFSFMNEGTEYSAVDLDSISDKLDEAGKAELSWTWAASDLGEPPGALYFQVEARVLEKGGRAVRETKIVPMDPYPFYVGLKKPELDYGYAKIGDEISVPCVVLDAKGAAAEGKDVTYRIYRNARSWWWEYDSAEAFRVRYKTDKQTLLVKEGGLVSKDGPVVIAFKPDAWGEYFLEVEVSDGGTSPKHRAGFFFRASAWSDQAGGENEGVMTLKTDRPVYYPGDRARVTLATPAAGFLLSAVEKGDRLLSSSWRRIEGNETTVEIPVTRDMIPNAYVSVSLFQPHGTGSNDRPLRMYGIAPLKVEDPLTRENLTLKTSEVLRPNKDFTVEVRTASGTQTQFTVAVVDEGLLDLTRFQTPDAWKSFYAKQRLALATLDLYSQVLGSYKDDVFRSFAIGGAEDAKSLAERELGGKKEDSRVKRFKPVALFSGVLKTDERGVGKATFSMPNYMGSVRVMAVSAKGARYGSSSLTVPVRSDIILLPNLPRVLGPGEKFRVPATVFVLEDGIGKVDVEIATEGPVKATGPKTQGIRTSKNSESDVYFELETLPAVGPAKITVTARGGSAFAREETEILVRASSPVIYRSEQITLKPGERRTFSVETGGLPGTNRTKLTVQRRGDLKLGNRLSWLIHYPYGCIEQTTSAAFPQLYLRNFIDSKTQDRAIDENIDAAIERLRKFQIPSGGFSYWPGQTEASAWGTNYAGHFLLEAKALGYAVPQDLLDRWMSFQQSAATAGRDGMEARIYRLYLLAKAGRPAIGPMNLIKETAPNLREMESWTLAAAFKLAGMERAAFDLAQRAGTEPKRYTEFAGTYGSDLRDRAMILDAALVLGLTDTADRIFDVIADHVSGNAWYSTQTLGYSLLSMGKYLAALKAGDNPVLSGTVTISGGGRKTFSTTEEAWTMEIPENPASRQETTVEIDSSAGASRVFALLEWEGQPLKYLDDAVSENFALQIEWRDQNGNTVDPAVLKQGEEFWQTITVTRTGKEYLDLAEIALTQILPSGWEPVNLRLTGETPPSWTGNRTSGREKYLDIRDDRISWFFDMPSSLRRMSFSAKYQAVTEGSFTLPPTQVHAMYRNDYRALIPGATVEVRARE